MLQDAAYAIGMLRGVTFSFVPLDSSSSGDECTVRLSHSLRHVIQVQIVAPPQVLAKLPPNLQVAIFFFFS